MGDDSVDMGDDSIDMGDDSIDMGDDSVDMGYLVTLLHRPTKFVMSKLIPDSIIVPEYISMGYIAELMEMSRLSTEKRSKSPTL
jgi:hypothetical protein